MLNLLSLVGAGMALAAYALLSFGFVTSKDLRYHGLNLVSSVLLGYVAVRTGVYGFMLLNATWGVVALYQLVTTSATVTMPLRGSATGKL